MVLFLQSQAEPIFLFNGPAVVTELIEKEQENELIIKEEKLVYLLQTNSAGGKQNKIFK